MHIEIKQKGKNWNWNFVNKGRITSFNDPSPSKQRAVSRSKGVITAAFKECGMLPTFTMTTNRETGVIVIRWESYKTIFKENIH